MTERVKVKMGRVQKGDVIRYRSRSEQPWFYHRVISQDESGLIHTVGQNHRRGTLTSVDAEWMFDRGNLEIKRGDFVKRVGA